jgi:uroporphyrinogen-III synthase
VNVGEPIALEAFLRERGAVPEPVAAVASRDALAPGADWSGAVALASHPRIAQAAQAAGFLRVHPVGAGWQGLAEAVARLESGPL